MKQVTATEAARRFSLLLDAVESRKESFVVVRRGRPVARIEPAPAATGKALKEFLRAHPPDRKWIHELRELRAGLTLEERDWND